MPIRRLHQFNALVKLHLQANPISPINAKTDIESSIASLERALWAALKGAGTPDRAKGHLAPWWTEECVQAHSRHRVAKNSAEPGTVPTETREFLAVVRKAKKDYWANRINNITTDKELYSLLGWHKLTPGQQDIPLIVNNQTISDLLAKAEALRVEILDRFSADDDLPEPVWSTELTPGKLP